MSTSFFSRTSMVALDGISKHIWVSSILIIGAGGFLWCTQKAFKSPRNLLSFISNCAVNVCWSDVWWGSVNESLVSKYVNQPSDALNVEWVFCHFDQRIFYMFYLDSHYFALGCVTNKQNWQTLAWKACTTYYTFVSLIHCIQREKIGVWFHATFVAAILFYVQSVHNLPACNKN